MNLDELTLGQLKELRCLFGEQEKCHAYPVGKNVYVRTVTMHYTGKLERVTPGELVLTDTAWIADSGRWAAALEKGVSSLSEVEPYPEGEVVVSRGAVLDVSVWNHPLPRETK